VIATMLASPALLTEAAQDRGLMGFNNRHLSMRINMRPIGLTSRASSTHPIVVFMANGIEPSLRRS
jgi:hypothetical protein